MRQEGQQLLPIHKQDLLNCDRLVRVRHEDLKDVKALVLHHLAVVAEEVHADLEVLAPVDIGRHDVVVGAVQQYLAEKLDRLPLRDVAVGLDQYVVVPVEKELKVDGKVSRYELLVFR